MWYFDFAWTELYATVNESRRRDVIYIFLCTLDPLVEFFCCGFFYNVLHFRSTHKHGIKHMNKSVFFMHFSSSIDAVYDSHDIVTVVIDNILCIDHVKRIHWSLGNNPFSVRRFVVLQ